MIKGACVALKKEIYTYPAVFSLYDDTIAITFPDLPGCTSQTRDGVKPTFEDAMELAREALALHLILMEDDGDEIPNPSPLSHLQTETHQALTIVEVALPIYRQQYDNKLARTNVTIPKWLKDMAQSKKINLSKVLTDGLYSVMRLNKKS